jgi:hypothetical protein
MKTIDLYESPKREQNEDKFGTLASNQCICCMKPMKEGETKMVHMNTSWQVMPNTIKTTEDAEKFGFESQGFWEVGNSCAKKMPKEYIHN